MAEQIVLTLKLTHVAVNQSLFKHLTSVATHAKFPCK